jgi:hypothetical protein
MAFSPVSFALGMGGAYVVPILTRSRTDLDGGR